MIDKEIIKKARQANLAEYLLGEGVPLIKNGNRYKHKEHDSLVFTGNAYYWNSRRESGNAVDYLMRHMNKGFIDAILALVSAREREQAQPITDDKLFELDHTKLSNNNEKIYSYLHDTRFIGHSTIDYFIDKKLLFLEKQTNNAFFLMRDENNNCVGAEVQGTAKKRFKGIKANSKYGYGFNVGFSEENTFDYALFFESAIDLMSFIDYKRNHENKTLNKCFLVSMAGLKTNIVKHTLKAFQGKLRIVLCVDNDSAGQAFKNEIEREQIKYIDKTPDKKYKDWNEQLVDAKRRKNQYSKPISRLIKSGLASNQKLMEQGKAQAQCKTETQEYEQLRL